MYFIQSDQKLKLRSDGYLDASLIMQSKCVARVLPLRLSHTRIAGLDSTCEGKRRLASLRITHLVNTHIVAHLDIAHALRRDQNELPAHGPPRSLNHHAHAGSAVDRVHENIELVQTADGAAHGFPDRKQQADSGEGLLASGQSLRLAAGV
jgi:hypothetical protein